MSADEDTARRIKNNTAAIVDNINKTEENFAPSVIDDYYEDLDNAIHELDVLVIQRKWLERQVALSGFTYR